MYTRSKAETREAIGMLEQLGLPYRVEELAIEDISVVGDLV